MMMKLELIDKISEPGSSRKANEDLIVVGEDLYVVLDGATGLGGQAIDSFPSDAVWFVRTFSDRLVEHWEQERNFIAALSTAIDACVDEYARLTGGMQGSLYEQPSAGMVAIAVEEGKISAYRLGDCTGYVSRGGLADQLFEQTPLEALDNRAIEGMVAELRQGKAFEEARRMILPMLQSHRALMNTPEGYGALSLSRDCLKYIESERISFVSGASVLLATDGFSAIQKYGRLDLGTLFKWCEIIGLAGVVGDIRKTENDDSELTRYPRLKRHDDATAVLLRLVSCPE